MRVTIVDTEWYMKKSFLPNPKCMKLSSYYKQQNAIINFAQNEFELKNEFDKMIVIKEDIMTSLPPINLMDERVELIGEGLKFYTRYKPDIDPIVAACRPDYLLYSLREENKMSKANIVQFFHNGKLIPLMQDYHNSYKKAHYTYVIDENFWEYPIDDLEKCYEQLKKENNIVFKFPINLDSILKENKKVEMLTSLKIDFEAVDVFCDLNSQEKIDNFIKLISKIKLSKRKRMCITTKMYYEKNHFQYMSQPFKDFYKYCVLIDTMKKLQLKLILIAPPRKDSPMWFHFEDLEAWTKYGIYKSFIEFMSFPNRQKIGCLNINEFFQNSLRWSDDGVYRMMTLWLNYPELMEKIGYTEWGDNRLEGINMLEIFKGKRIR